MLMNGKSCLIPIMFTETKVNNCFIDTASNHVIRNIYNSTNMSTKDSHFAECEVSLSRFLLRHRLYYWSDRPILCGNLIEFDGKKCLYSRSFRFYKHFDVSEKNMGCLAHQKYVCCIFILFIANADKIQKYKIE